MAIETLAPLLGNTTPPSNSGIDEFEKPPTLPQIIEEIKSLYAIALPLIMTGLLVFGKSAISMLFMGRLGKAALAGGSLATGIANITGYSIISGLAMGMEGISSQACGARLWHLMGQTLQRTIAFLLVASIPISVLWVKIEPVLIMCHQNREISSLAASYLVYCIPDLILQSVIHPFKIFLRTQELTHPVMHGAAIVLALHAPLNYLFSVKLEMGIRGIAVASSTSNLIFLATLVWYAKRCCVLRRCWPGWSLACFTKWQPIVRLAVPSAVAVCLEWWWYEVMILLSGLFPNATDAVASMGIMIQATSFLYKFPSSLGEAVSTRVGNELGAHQPGRARASCIVAVFCAAFNGVVSMGLMFVCRNYWSGIYTGDEGVRSLTAVALVVAGFCELGNCPQTTGCGVLRGCARPNLGARINLASFYGAGLPVAVVMGFVLGKGFVGLWMGLLAAQIVCSVVMITVLSRIDWSEEANRAEDLIGVGKYSGLLGRDVNSAI